MEGDGGAEGEDDLRGRSECLDDEATQTAEVSPFLRLRGLPFSASAEDIQAFFAPLTCTDIFVAQRIGKPTGDAFVQLSDASAAAEALATMHKKNLGARYIELFPSSEGEVTAAKAQGRKGGFVVRLRGLPYNAAASDVLAFFEGLPVVRGLEGVIFTYAPDGRPNGECFVELQTETAQQAALAKHKEAMGSRYIEVFTSTKADLIRAVQTNRTILGNVNRRQWLQSQGVAAVPLFPQPVAVMMAPQGSQLHAYPSPDMMHMMQGAVMQPMYPLRMGPPRPYGFNPPVPMQGPYAYGGYHAGRMDRPSHASSRSSPASTSAGRQALSATASATGARAYEQDEHGHHARQHQAGRYQPHGSPRHVRGGAWPAPSAYDAREHDPWAPAPGTPRSAREAPLGASQLPPHGAQGSAWGHTTGPAPQPQQQQQQQNYPHYSAVQAASHWHTPSSQHAELSRVQGPGSFYRAHATSDSEHSAGLYSAPGAHTGSAAVPERSYQMQQPSYSSRHATQAATPRPGYDGRTRYSEAHH